jgi:4-amino-4-deoxy-L-arabinose transferase-like glycosyltransferase
MISIFRHPQEAFSFFLLLLFSSIFFLDFSQRDLWSAGEARAALIAEQMLQSRDYILPQLYDGPTYTKPPLFYWLVCLGPLTPEGRLGGSAVRLPSVLSACLLLLLVFFIGERWLPPHTGLLAALILGTNFKFFWMARVGRIDMIFTLFIFISLMAFYQAYQTHQKRYYFLTGLSSGLASLAKGPLALLLLALAGFLTFLLEKRLKDFIRKEKILLLLLLLSFFLVCFPWYLLIHLQTQGEFSREFLIRHHLTRFLGDSDLFKEWFSLEDGEESAREFDTWQPFWYMIPRFFGDFFPWSLFLPLLFFLYRKKNLQSPPIPPDPFLSFLKITSLTFFLFFSLSSFKRGDYMLPLFPPISLLLAAYWKDLLRLKKAFSSLLLFFLISYTLFLGILTLTSLFPSLIFQQELWKSLLKKPDYANFQKIYTFFQTERTLVLLFASLLGILLGFLFAKRKQPSAFAYLLASTLWISFVFVVLFFFPFFDEIRSLKPFCQSIHQKVPEESPLWGVGNAYDPQDLHYHLQRKFLPLKPWEKLLPLLHDKNTPPSYFLLRAKDLKRLQEATNSPLSFQVLLENEESSRTPLVLIYAPIASPQEKK